MITRDRDSGIPANPESRGVQQQTIIRTLEEAYRQIYDPELPVVIVPGFSLESDGNIVWESNSDSSTELRINGNIEDVLRSVVPMVAAGRGSSSGKVEIQVKALSSCSYAQDSIGHTIAEREVVQIKVQDIEAQEEQLRQQWINSVSIPFDSKKEAEDFAKLLKPETKRTFISFTDGTLHSLIVWFGEAYPISVIIKTA